MDIGVDGAVDSPSTLETAWPLAFRALAPADHRLSHRINLMEDPVVGGGEEEGQ